MLNHTSQLVRYVFHLLCKGEETVAPDVPEDSLLKVRHFQDRRHLWDYCHAVQQLKDREDLQRSYLEVREDLIQRLSRLRKMHKESLEEHIRQLEHIEEVIKGLEDRRFHYSREVERFREQADREATDRCEERLKEFDEEIAFRRNVLNVQMELSQARFPDITQLEEELQNVESLLGGLRKEGEELAEKMNVEREIGIMIFDYILNEGYFTRISVEEWDRLFADCSSKEQSWLKEHYREEAKDGLWVLNDEQHYFSPLRRRMIVGSRPSTGISFLDYNIKKLLSEKLRHLTFTRYEDDVRTFYAFLSFGAMEDGVLSQEEGAMMQSIAEALHMEKSQARQILNKEAIRIQKEFINENMELFYRLAMADGHMHREEAKFLVEMKAKLEDATVPNVAQVIDRLEKEDLHLQMDDEQFFIEMCTLALKDQRLDLKEQEMLKQFVAEKGWDPARGPELIARAQNRV